MDGLPLCLLFYNLKATIFEIIQFSPICGHRLKDPRHLVCSAISKLQIARLVLKWATIREYLVLQWFGRNFFLTYVFHVAAIRA